MLEPPLSVSLQERRAPAHKREERTVMSIPFDVGVFVGSLRKESFSRKTAHALIALAPTSLKLGIVEIGNLPLYNQDDEKNPPPASVAFKDRVREARAVLFVTPEYNRSTPGVLKNAIDIASRPYGDSAWNGKPGGVVSVSPGAVGGFGANHHLRQSMVFLNVPMMPQPEAYVGGAAKLFDASGALTDDSARDFLKKYMEAFARWVERNAAP
jgi:chromate reductase